VFRAHIVEQCADCNVKKNSNGLYNHDDIVKAKETIEGKLKEVFLDHILGLTMVDLLDTKNNTINIVKTTQMITADALITQAKKDAMAAEATAKKVAKSLGTAEVEVNTIIMTREEAKREAERQNIANQTIVGTKVGLVDVLKRLIGGAILDTVIKIANGSRDKSIDDYKLHEVFQLAFDNAVRPELGCIFLFQEYPFLGPVFRSCPGFLRIPVDSCFFQRIFFTGTSFCLDAGIRNYSGITGILRNSCSRQQKLP
jgi:hypothetical protein